MSDQFSRTRLIIGEEAIKKLQCTRVIVFGVGGVGSYAVEALARAGIGAIDIVDSDTVNVTNINRQIIALHSTIGRKKVDVMRERLMDINPKAEVTSHDMFFTQENADHFDFRQYSYVIDAIDTVSSKLTLIKSCKDVGTPVISSMGTGNKLDPTKLTVTDIYKTSMCPLAKVMRHELRKLNIKDLKVVYSTEKPRRLLSESDEVTVRRSVPGSISFVPPVAGFIIAGEVIKDITNIR